MIFEYLFSTCCPIFVCVFSFLSVALTKDWRRGGQPATLSAGSQLLMLMHLEPCGTGRLQWVAVSQHAQSTKSRRTQD